MQNNSAIIGLRDLRENIEKYSQKITQGNSFLVVRRSKPLFKLVPPFEGQEEARWEEVVDFTKIKRGGVNIDEIISRL